MWSKTIIRSTARAALDDAGGQCSLSADKHETLVRQAKSGNALAFEQLAWRYDEAILGMLLMLTASEQEALSLCRATFVSAYQQLARRTNASLYIWLYQLAAMQWLERARKPAAGDVLSGADPLSARERLVFTLKAGQRLGLRTVAQILQESEDTVARAFSRAVCKLRMAARAAS